MIEGFWVFHCAYVRVPRRVIVADGGWRLVRLPFLCGLAHHSELGPILFDAPYGHEGPANVGNLMGALLQGTALQFEERWSVVPRLEQLGFRPADVAHVCITHLHADHTGAMKTLAHSKFYISRREWEAAHRGSSRRAALRGYVRDDFSALESRVELQDSPPTLAAGTSGLDLFGDRSVEMFLLPGHTPGHAGFRIHLDDGSTVFFAGDAAFTLAQLRGEEKLGIYPRKSAASLEEMSLTMEKITDHLRRHPDEIPVVCHDFDLGRRSIEDGPVDVRSLRN